MEIPVTNDNKYADCLSECISIKEKFEKIINKEIFNLITKALEYQNEMSSIEMEDAFIERFSLAMSSLLESFSKK